MNGVDPAREKRVTELALRCAHTGRTQFTRFLEPALFDLVRAAAGRAGVQAVFWGGYEEAERRVAALYAEDAPAAEDYPIQTLRIDWNAKFGSPGHRDLLGAVMGLGIERETTGDIALGTWRGAPCAYLFATEEMADYIAASLDGAGRVSVKVSVQTQPPQIDPPEGDALRLTVQHARLDAVLAAAQKLSRGEAQRLIAGGLVKLNHVECLRPDARLEAGDLISARGYGRVKVLSFEGESRRGRLILRAFRTR